MPLGRLPSSSSLPNRSARPFSRAAPSVPTDPVARIKAKASMETVQKAPSRLEHLRQELQANQESAKSAAHVGVVQRPMNQHVVQRPTEQNLSHLTDKKREEVLGPSTSVARLGAEDAQDALSRGTSVARLGQDAEPSHTTSVARLDPKKGIGDLN